MSNPEKLEIGFLIELVITGEADRKQFDEVMERVQKEAAIAALYQQALAEHRLLEAQLQAVNQKLVQDQTNAELLRENQTNAELLRAQALEEELRLQQENDLSLGM